MVAVCLKFLAQIKCYKFSGMRAFPKAMNKSIRLMREVSRLQEVMVLSFPSMESRCNWMKSTFPCNLVIKPDTALYILIVIEDQRILRLWRVISFVHYLDLLKQ